MSTKVQTKKISILIPTYNYSIFDLVKSLHDQVERTLIKYEVLCFDDASTVLLPENEKINTLSNCTYITLKQNIGRSSIRNLLAKTAQFDNLLFLDADTIPIHENFIENYITLIDQQEKVVYGGIQYQNKKPSKTELLRWIYGNSREAMSVKKRNENVYLSFLTLNFMISKSIFKKVTFNENIPNLRHEDTLFSYDLSKNKILIQHINNPVFHLGLEESRIFLEKSEESVKNLIYLIKNDYLPSKYVSLSKYSIFLKKIGLRSAVSFCFSKFRNKFVKNLLSKKPSMLVFDLYRLGYFCNLNKK